MQQMDDFYATIQRQAYFALFEKKAHEMIASGTTVDQLNVVYLDNLHDQFGEVVSVSDEFKWEWVSIPHIFATPFYVYAYTFGQLLVLSLYKKYKEETKAEQEEVMKAGGLAIIGTERHESRRIDNQLRGRAGRQGDPGSSRFYISLEDDLMRLFGSERISSVVEKIGLEEDMPIEHKMLTKSIEGAQKKVEGRNFGIRKHVLQYDDVMNKQREVIYNQRRTLLTEDNLRPLIFGMLNDVVHECVIAYADEKTYPEEWDWDGFDRRLYDLFGFGHSIPVEQRPQAKPADLEQMIIHR